MQKVLLGAGIGTTVGIITDAIIGKKIDKAAKEAATIEDAIVDNIRDANNLKSVKVTFDSGILFQKGKSNLNSSTSDALTKFAKIVVNNPTMDIAILGHADNAGSFEVNQKLSQYRAQSVAYFLKLQKYTFFTI